MTDPGAAPVGLPSVRQGWWILAVLVVLYIASMLDRQIIALLIEPIKASLQIGDLETSLVYGLAFAVFFCLAGIPVGFAIDRYPRRPIVFCGVVIWSIATACCGLSSQYWHLAVSRFAVGAGEAVLSPAAYSLLADALPKRQLGRALGIFGIGGALGTGVALAIGGFLLLALPAGGLTTALGAFETWQLTFIVVAIPALCLAPLIYSFPEPRRRERLATRPTSLRAGINFITSRAGFYGRFFVGNGCLVLCTYGFAAWVPTFLVRRFGLTMPEASHWVALAAVVAVPIGLFGLGYATDRLFQRGRRDAHMLLFSGIGLVFAILGWCMASAHSLSTALVCIFAIFAASGIAPIAAAVPLTTPNEYRGQVSAVYLLATNLLGVGLGPTAVAAFTDLYFKSDAMVGWSVAAVMITFGPLSSALLYSARRPMIVAIDAASEWADCSS